VGGLAEPFRPYAQTRESITFEGLKFQIMRADSRRLHTAGGEPTTNTEDRVPSSRYKVLTLGN
jgi:Mg2+/Co2+ transporter CorC